MTVLEQIKEAQIVLPCRELNDSLEFYTGKLGFRVEMIYPADAPQVAVVSGYGLTLRLETSDEKPPLTLRLLGDFSIVADDEREFFSPDGVRVAFVERDAPVEVPEGGDEFIVTTFDDKSAWSAGRAGMQYRDLIPGRLSDRFVASHISIPAGGEIPDYVHYHRVRFQMIYCIAGWARLVYENQGAPFLMKAGDCVLQPPEIRHRVLESSAKFEVLEIGCPAIHETHADHRLDLPNERIAPDEIYGGQRFLHHQATTAVWQNSEIENIQSRDTKISKASNGLADVRLLRAVADANFAVNHSGEFLFFFVLEGNLQIKNEEGAIYNLKTNDSVVVPRGKMYQAAAGKNLEMLSVSLPAEEF